MQCQLLLTSCALELCPDRCRECLALNWMDASSNWNLQQLQPGHSNDKLWLWWDWKGQINSTPLFETLESRNHEQKYRDRMQCFSRSQMESWFCFFSETFLLSPSCGWCTPAFTRILAKKTKRKERKSASSRKTSIDHTEKADTWESAVVLLVEGTEWKLKNNASTVKERDVKCWKIAHVTCDACPEVKTPGQATKATSKWSVNWSHGYVDCWEYGSVKQATQDRQTSAQNERLKMNLSLTTMLMLV